MSEREAFEKALESNKYDWDTRKVFCDWLEENGFDDEAAEHRLWTPDWQEAEDWIKAFCERVDLSYPYFLKEGARFLKDGGYIDVHINTSNLMMDENPGEIWKNLAVLLRTDPTVADNDPFTCGSSGCFMGSVLWNEWSQGIDDD